MPSHWATQESSTAFLRKNRFFSKKATPDFHYFHVVLKFKSTVRTILVQNKLVYL